MKRLRVFLLSACVGILFSCKKNPNIDNCVKGPVQANCNCPNVKSYVCGCDNVTYINGCFARCDGVNFYTVGKCQ